ncbi:MAG: pyridoxal phosphate-dependent decarboxylase family protein [Flammeovirgaceae bacterium]
MNQLESTSQVLQDAFDPDRFRSVGRQLIDLLSHHFEETYARKKPQAIPYQSPEEALAFWKKDFRTKTSALNVFEEVLARSINVHHPRNMGHQVTVPALIGGLAGLVSDVLSNGTGVFEVGMASNAMERIITSLVATTIGFDEQANGLFTSGGTLANLTALLAARQAKAPSKVWDVGHQEKLAIIVSEEAHYCIDRAARIMGFGKEGIIKVPVDEQFKIRTDLLEKHLANAKAQDLHVIALVGCASSTATGAYDDLAALGQFCQKHNLWFHVDGAHGGAVVFSKKHQPLVKGIELADTVVIDFHKMLLTPALSTALIFSDGALAYQTFQQRAQYLWDAAQEEEWYNSGKRTFECTKFMMVLKVYALIKEFGLEVFEENIDCLYAKTQAFAKLIQNRSSFRLAVEPEANILNFQYVDVANENINQLNSQIRQQLLEEGKFYIVQTMLGDQRYLRTTIMNPHTTELDFMGLLDEIEQIALKLKG